MCTRIVKLFLDDYDERLSQFIIEELCTHLNVLLLKYVSVQLYDDHLRSDLHELTWKIGWTAYHD